MKITGQCHCGFVTYHATLDPRRVSICHCTDCQRLTGSAFRVTASVPAGDFTLTGGQPRRYLKHGDNGAARLQFFCPNCGSPIYTTGEGADAETIQNAVYEIGKTGGFESLRDWFKALYETLLGSSQGPRMGSFIALYGVVNSRKLIADALARAG